MTFFLIALLHVVVALLYRHAFGVRMGLAADTSRWEAFFQTLPMSALRENLAESIWYLHAQPPLFSLYGAFFARVFPEDPLGAMHYANIVLGALSAGMLYAIALTATGSRPLSIAIGVGYALHPALFLFEAFELYTLPASALVIASLFFVARYRDRGRLPDLYAMILVLNLLVLTRSVFHVGILLIAIVFVTLLAGARWRRVVVVCCAISLLSVGWYAKNRVVFGEFTASTWFGQSLWKVASWRQPNGLIDELVERGVIDRMVTEVLTFQPPSRYAEFGFDATSDVAALSRDDLHNLNVVAISNAYGANAMRLLRESPGPYVGTVYKAYRTFSMPSAGYGFLDHNAEKIGSHVSVDRVLQGRWAAEQIRGWTDGKADFGSFFFFLLPLAVLGPGVVVVRRCRFERDRWAAFVRAEPVLCFAWILIVYTTVVGCGFELLENDRFKFLIEGCFWLLAIASLYRWRFAPTRP